MNLQHLCQWLVAAVVLLFVTACDYPGKETVPTGTEIYIDSERYGHFVDRIAIKQGDRFVADITINESRWDGEVAVYIGLPYESMAWSGDDSEDAFSAWDPLVAGGPPALVVQEYVSGGSAPGSHRWVMRIFLWEKGTLRELPPIPGAGEVYYFKDLNGDGSLEFVNQEAVSALPKTHDGLPISPRVYRFGGERYLPTGEKEASSGK